MLKSYFQHRLEFNSGRSSYSLLLRLCSTRAGPSVSIILAWELRPRQYQICVLLVFVDYIM